jgi:hypothetical protein
MSDRRRAIIETILADPNASASDRLRALELERELAPSRADLGFDEHVGKLNTAGWDEELDAYFVADVVAAVLAGKARQGIDPADFPATAKVLEVEFERRARELADADRIEAEIERRSEERARVLYRERAFEVHAEGSGEDARTKVDPEPSRPRRPQSP